MSSCNESSINQLNISASTLPNKDEHIERVVSGKAVRRSLVVDHMANLRKNSKISPSGHSGTMRRLEWIGTGVVSIA
jgi:hypothetical protein